MDPEGRAVRREARRQIKELGPRLDRLLKDPDPDVAVVLEICRTASRLRAAQRLLEEPRVPA